MKTTIELTQKQVNRIMIIGTIVILGLTALAMTIGSVSNLGALGF